MMRQRQDVVGPFGERRDAQLDEIQAIEQVLAEPALGNGRAQIGVGRADDAHLHLARDAAAEPLELARLQDTQQLRLSFQRQVADLIEKQRAAVGGFEASLARLRGAGERAGLGAEQFRFHQILGQGTHVHLDERAAADRRIRLDDRGDDFLARAVRAGDQHGNVRRRDVGRLGDHIAHGIAFEDQPAQVKARRQRRARLGAFLHGAFALHRQPAQFEQIAHRRQQPRVVPGLGEIVRGAGLHQFDRGFQVSPGREQHDRYRRIAFADRMEQRHALLARSRLLPEVHVLQDQVDLVRDQRAQSFLRTVRTDDAMALQRQQHFQRRADRVVVVDDEDGGHGRLTVDGCQLTARDCVFISDCQRPTVNRQPLLHHTVRVAIAGGIAAARRAGTKTAICPRIHNSTTPVSG